MLRYLLKRLIQAVFVLWAAFTASFLVLYALPGDPVSIMLNAGGTGEEGTVSPAQAAALSAEYGLDKPLGVQYLDRLVHALHGDLGTSVHTGTPVSRMVVAALPATLELATTALLLGVLAGAAIALGASYLRVRPVRQVLLSLPSVGVSVPSFWVGLVALQLFSFRFRLFPAVGGTGVSGLVLPAATLALPTAAVVAQVLARGLRDALTEPYVLTARAKGAGRARVLLGHATRNAALPALTVAGVVTGNLLAGSVVVETVFSRDGVGRLTVTAVSTQDIPVVQGVVVFAALAFVAVNLIVDLVCPLLDPRLARRVRPAAPVAA